MNIRRYAAFFMIASAAYAAPISDIDRLRQYVQTAYPSLLYVDRYRQAFPDDTQGGDALWRSKDAIALDTPSDLTAALAGLKDQHVSIAVAGSTTETLGVLFRTSTGGGLMVWRIVDPAITTLVPDETVLTIDGVDSTEWLPRMAERTFGGNQRARMAEAGLQLALGSRLQHEVYGLGQTVTLTVRGGDGAVRTVVLPYQQADKHFARRIAEAANQPDLPPTFKIGQYGFATIRFGAFAPQFDPEFIQAADAASDAGKADEEAMLAGFCAVVQNHIARYNRNSKQRELLVVDLRGNFGGFGREARLLAEAISPTPLPRSLDVRRSDTTGTLQIIEQPSDPSCGHIDGKPKIIVWVDAGTRSSGELMAAWLWSAGALIVGERTIGAGGGRDAASQGITLPEHGYRVLTSENFTVFEQGSTLNAGDMNERELVDLVSQDQFAPSRIRPFAIQSVGIRPDIVQRTHLADIKDGGLKGLINTLMQNMPVFEKWLRLK
ncbi:hypothetical protein KSF73_05115 [Burkholderiaceae bacterium DAT-1]|nr:hypothetical protein [Burkholderiaceae bacterium DAT-1]